MQERLIFRFQTFLRDSIRAFRPSPSDLDYPARLGATPTATLASPGSADPEAGRVTAAGAHCGVHRGCYPTLPRALGSMARVYCCVPRAVFEGLAQEAVRTHPALTPASEPPTLAGPAQVSDCTASLLYAGSMLRAKGRQLDALLFEVRLGSAWAPHVHCMGTACALHGHRMCTAWTPHVHCMDTACALHVHCMDTALRDATQLAPCPYPSHSHALPL